MPIQLGQKLRAKREQKKAKVHTLYWDQQMRIFQVRGPLAIYPTCYLTNLVRHEIFHN